MALVRNKCREEIFPIGKLDKKTTGLILFSNDNDLTKKLTKKSLKLNAFTTRH